MDGLKLIRKQDTQDNSINAVTDEVTRARSSVQVNYPTLKTRLDAIDTNADIIQNNINQIISGLQWKASVTTFNELANVYPNPQEGWTVSVNDTNYVYRFDADTNQWQPISSNSIGVAIPNGANGLMTGIDKAKLDGLNANDYVKKTGDTITGQLTVNGNINGNLNGNSSSATKLQTSRKINGTDFDGSADIITEKWGEVRNIQIGNSIKQVDGSQNINFDLNDIGVSPANHNHDNDYLKLSGGNLTGDVNTTNSINFTDINGRIKHKGSVILRNNDVSTVLSAINGTIIFRPQGHDTTTNQAALFPNGDFTAVRFVGELQGNSTSATRLQNARTIQLTGAVTGQANFDGSQNIQINTTLANPLQSRLVRQRNSVTVNAATNTVNIGIPAYNVNDDILNVYLFGVRLDPVVDYTNTQTQVILTGNKQFNNGDVVSFEVIQLA